MSSKSDEPQNEEGQQYIIGSDPGLPGSHTIMVRVRRYEGGHTLINEMRILNDEEYRQMIEDAAATIVEEARKRFPTPQVDTGKLRPNFRYEDHLREFGLRYSINGNIRWLDKGDHDWTAPAP